MSAIWGIIAKKKGEAVLKQDLMQMTGYYKEHCKIDLVNEKVADGIAFGCGVQFVTEESRREKLPSCEQDIWFTADCILDNREELCEILQISEQATDGDILYQAYLNWGIDFLKRARGLFAVAIYDHKKETFYLATDPVSYRCIFYYHEGENIYFSTLIEPICRVCSNIGQNELYWKDFFVAPGMMPNLFPGDTMYKGVYQVKPGSYVEIKKNDLQQYSYWNRKHQKKSKKSAEYYAKKFLKTYEKCVSSALRTDKEVAVCLSSGFDSSSVAALAALQLEKKERKLYSYTYVPAIQPKSKKKDYFINSEEALVREFAKKYTNIEPEFLNNQGKNFLEDYDDIREILEMPVKASVNLPNLKEIYENAYRKNCRIVLSGQFGNSTVSYGDIKSVLYDLYKRKKYITYFKYLDGYCKNTVRQSRKEAFVGMKSYIKYAKEQEGKANRVPFSIQNPFIEKEILQNYSIEERMQYVRKLFEREGLPDNEESRIYGLEMEAPYMYIGAYETKLGLAAGVVVRDPTRDVRMIDFCNELPFEYFCYEGCVRWLIRGVMKQYLPASYVNVWPRYGIQNVDWHFRILRDWPKVRERFAMIPKREDRRSFINEKAIEELLQRIDASYEKNEFEEVDWEAELQCLCFLL